jgi:hypothetical protein
MSGADASSMRLVFSGGQWVQVDVGAFADPALTEGQRLFAAAVVAAERRGGASLVAAVQAAEKRLYGRILGCS